MATSIPVALSWGALGFATAAGVFATFSALLHIFVLAGGLLHGFQHDSTVDDRRNAMHLAVAAGICALIAAAVGSVTFLIANFQ